MPALSSLVPRVAVSYGKAGGRDVAAGQFGTWRDVSVWLAGLSDAPAALSDPVARKARELTAGAATERDRVAALARFAQSVPYASIQPTRRRSWSRAALTPGGCLGRLGQRLRRRWIRPPFVHANTQRAAVAAIASNRRRTLDRPVHLL